jgi:hypothetical protein
MRLPLGFIMCFDGLQLTELHLFFIWINERSYPGVVGLSKTLRTRLDALIFTSIHVCWSGLGWKIHSNRIETNTSASKQALSVWCGKCGRSDLAATPISPTHLICKRPRSFWCCPLTARSSLVNPHASNFLLACAAWTFVACREAQEAWAARQ